MGCISETRFGLARMALIRSAIRKSWTESPAPITKPSGEARSATEAHPTTQVSLRTGKANRHDPCEQENSNFENCRTASSRNRSALSQTIQHTKRTCSQNPNQTRDQHAANIEPKITANQRSPIYSTCQPRSFASDCRDTPKQNPTHPNADSGLLEQRI